MVRFSCVVGSADIAKHKRARPIPLHSEAYYIAERDFFSFLTIQMQKMSYLKVEPKRNVTIAYMLNHATANCFFHRRRMMQWLSLNAGSTDIVEHKQARPFPLVSAVTAQLWAPPKKTFSRAPILSFRYELF